MDNKSRIRAFIARFTGDAAVKDDDNIFELGLVNSLFTMQLVVFIEREFSLTIQNDELNLDNFKSVDAINALIDSKSKPGDVYL